MFATPLLAETVVGYWTETTNQRKYMDWLGKQLGVLELEDWYSVKHKEVSERSKVVLQEKN